MFSRLRRLFRPEQRAVSYGPVGFGPQVGGTRVNAVLAENLSTVTACVNAISSGAANLPAYVYRTTDAGRVEAPEHPVSRLLRQPNSRQSWPDFVEMLMGQTLLHGNGLAAIEADAAGNPVALWPVPWSAVQVVFLPSGRLAFDVVATAGNGQPRRYLDSEVLLLRDRSDDGYLGRSRISRAPDVLAAAIGLQTFSAALWRNAVTPSGVFTLPANISPDGLRRFKEHAEAMYAGADNARRLLFADRDVTFTPMSVSPEDAEVLASRRFSVEELCRLFNVPPPIVQDYSHNTFTNSAQANTWMATQTLAPWVRKIEAEFQRQVFGADSPYSLELDMSGLVRGDYATRWQANVKAVQAGILTADEVREAEGYSPQPAAAPGAGDPVVPGDAGA